ncbi:hypothetical protein BSKO_05031 [Bryopsis sp. KO-2023]|nr:hypothetical protein BSKO_05031 [Bryopsis sp. KO-2023]
MDLNEKQRAVDDQPAPNQGDEANRPEDAAWSDFDVDREEQTPSKAVGVETAASPATTPNAGGTPSSFQGDDEEYFPRPKPIRTSSQTKLHKKPTSPLTTEIEEEPQPTPEPSKEGRREGDVGGWGWGGGWNFNKVGGALRRVAADVADDVKGLTTSFQEAFREGDEWAVEEEEEESSQGRRDPPAGTSGPLFQPDDRVSAQVLERLQGEDTTLEQGLKAIDDQMEQFTAGVGRALGSLWGGLGGAVKVTQNLASKVENAARTATTEIVGTVEEGVKDVKDLDAVKKAQSGLKAAAGVGEMLAHKAEKGLETVGRRAIALLDASPGDGIGEKEAEEAVSFDSSFYIYGGQQHWEALEGICNECAKECNRTRAILDDPAKERLDGTVTTLHPIFEVDGSPSESEDEDGYVKGVDSRFTPSYSMVIALTSGSVEEASSMVVRAEDRLGEWVDDSIEVPTPPSSPGSTGSPVGPRPNLRIDPQIAAVEGRETLVRIHNEGVKRLAELCTCCMQSLLEVARNLKSGVEDGKTKEDGVWPESCEETGQLLRGYTVRLVHDLESVAGAFVEALLGVGTSFDEKLGDLAVRQKSASLASDLEVDARTAVNRVKEGFRSLMYVVLCTMVSVRDGEKSTPEASERKDD